MGATEFRVKIRPTSPVRVGYRDHRGGAVLICGGEGFRVECTQHGDVGAGFFTDSMRCAHQVAGFHVEDHRQGRL